MTFRLLQYKNFILIVLKNFKVLILILWRDVTIFTQKRCEEPISA